ncbi:hypothetical protein [Morganella morganii]|uniref:hypothetical protein n=1 Tax=Morganella morganii TaxID=582 RepID=UPI001BDB6FDB|nr:hypothetical protein [Morganella morganii]MBT0461617.1 hypothetical protein [Morganella morganii subsp. morganii]
MLIIIAIILLTACLLAGCYLYSLDTHCKPLPGNETNVSIGELKVETQATDAQGMAAGAKDALGSQLQDLGHQTNTGLGK